MDNDPAAEGRLRYHVSGAMIERRSAMFPGRLPQELDRIWINVCRRGDCRPIYVHDRPASAGSASMGVGTMASDTIERLLTTLSVRLHAFAVCEIKVGWRLGFDPMDGVTIHYVLAGSGTIRVGNGRAAANAPCSMIVVPAGLSQSLGTSGHVLGEANAANDCGLLADGLVKFSQNCSTTGEHPDRRRRPPASCRS